MADEPNTRDQAYLDLLGRGLFRVRDCAACGEFDLCRIEADHLHNIPSLLGEANENRHVYYIDIERGLYRERLRMLAATERVTEYIEVSEMLYSEAWRALASAAGLGLLE
ncbi:MAG TPA: hypothetical protein VGM05_16100 [Planctomycetaceae bacterium]